MHGQSNLWKMFLVVVLVIVLFVFATSAFAAVDNVGEPGQAGLSLDVISQGFENALQSLLGNSNPSANLGGGEIQGVGGGFRPVQPWGIDANRGPIH